ncbi:MAG: nucleotide exchange factor GrpE [Eubacteriales bacterium]|nr:nucleotide exchange factor GrpE [Eubacteriales bacterium]
MEDEKDLKEKTADGMEETVADINEAESAAETLDEADMAEASENAEETEGEAAEGTAEKAAGETAEEASKPDKKDKQIEELNDKYKRLFAEFDNYRKRTETEKLGMFAEGEKTVLLKVLPLIDNFERALGTIPEEQKGTALADGIEKIYRSFTDQLKDLGVTPIEAEGKPFDANLHNAVMHEEDESLPENIVTAELQKGYMFKDKVLRYSMVKVAN